MHTLINYKIVVSVLFILMTVTFFTACKDQKSFTNQDLYGHWNFVKSYRNGTETKTVNTGYFQLNPDNTIESNIFQISEQKKFVVENNKLKIKGTEAFVFNIENLVGDTLELSGKMGYFDMAFLLAKQHQ